ncbi:MAG TPA: ester cyclase [Micromonosporaceae bacterium]|nr:ester cyclase [Micromonosporaceae bacterium]
MTPEQRVVLAAIDAVNAGHPDSLDDLVSVDLVDHGALRGENACTAGVRYEVHDVFGSGDRVAVRATVRGLHTSGRLGFAATGRPFAVATMHICRVTGGLLTEHWCVRDDMTLLRQVGVLTNPGG